MSNLELSNLTVYYTTKYAYLKTELTKRLYYDCFGRTAFSDDFFSGTCNLVSDGYRNIHKYNCLLYVRYKPSGFPGCRTLYLTVMLASKSETRSIQLFY